MTSIVTKTSVNDKIIQGVSIKKVFSFTRLSNYVYYFLLSQSVGKGDFAVRYLLKDVFHKILFYFDFEISMVKREEQVKEPSPRDSVNRDLGWFWS